MEIHKKVKGSGKKIGEIRKRVYDGRKEENGEKVEAEYGNNRN